MIKAPFKHKERVHFFMSKATKNTVNNEKFENILEVQGINAKGFGTIAKMVMLDQRLSIEAKAIYSYFCSYAGGGNSAFPSVSKIIYDLGVSKTRYYKHFKLLTECGYISVRRNKQEGNKFDNNIYTLNFNPVAQEVPCPQNEETEKPCPHFGDTGNEDTNINNHNINNLLNNNNNVNPSTDENIFNIQGLDSIANTFTNEVKTVIKAFKDTTSENIVPTVLYNLNTLVDQHGYEFVYHAITRASKDINVNYLKKVLNSSSYAGKKSIEEVEQAISEYNKPQKTKRNYTKKPIRTEIVPNWLKEQSENTNDQEYVLSATQTTGQALEDQIIQPNTDQPQLPSSATTKTIDEFIEEWSFAPYETIMFKLEQNGFDRHDVTVINKVMKVKGIQGLM